MGGVKLIACDEAWVVLSEPLKEGSEVGEGLGVSGKLVAVKGMAATFLARYDRRRLFPESVVLLTVLVSADSADPLSCVGPFLWMVTLDPPVMVTAEAPLFTKLWLLTRVFPSRFCSC